MVPHEKFLAEYDIPFRNNHRIFSIQAIPAGKKSGLIINPAGDGSVPY
jgi:hypothetical protein